MPWRVEQSLATLLGGNARAVDGIVFGNVRRKTADQIANARTAVAKWGSG